MANAETVTMICAMCGGQYRRDSQGGHCSNPMCQPKGLCARGCGRRVSDNKEYCLECSTKTMTHVVTTIKSNNAEILSRVCDGIIIGQRQNATVIFGDRPNKRDSHVFIDDASASRFLRTKVATEDLKNIPDGGNEVLIEERDGEKHIIMPEGVMQLPQGISRMH